MLPIIILKAEQKIKNPKHPLNIQAPSSRHKREDLERERGTESGIGDFFHHRGVANGEWRCFAGEVWGALSPLRGLGRSLEKFLKGSIFECKKQTMGAVRIRHSIREFATQPVILWILLGGKPKWLPLNFGFNDVMRTDPILPI